MQSKDVRAESCVTLPRDNDSISQHYMRLHKVSFASNWPLITEMAQQPNVVYLSPVVNGPIMRGQSIFLLINPIKPGM